MHGRRLLRTGSLAVALVAVTATLAACGTGDESSAPATSAEQTRNNPLEHIHGLAVSPDDGSLFIATHVGLYRAAAGRKAVEPVGDTRKDVMGFSIASRDRFIGSGHPGEFENLPPNLGLIESRDGGKTWEPVSLLGQADFHVLRSRGERVYGFDGTEGRFLVSDDGGREWATRQIPAPMLDVALGPDDPDRLIAATQAGLYASSDAGRRWRAVDPSIAGLLAWPRADALFIVDPAGQVQKSTDQGRSFRPVGTAGGEPAAFMADGDDLYVALSDGTVNRSSDGGATWSVRAAP